MQQTMQNQESVAIRTNEVRKILQECGAYYERKDKHDPWVAYPEEYEPEKQRLGKTYVNLAVIEQDPSSLQRLGDHLHDMIIERVGKYFDFCMMPQNRVFAHASTLGSIAHHARRVIYLDKKTIEKNTNSSTWVNNMQIVIVQDILDMSATVRVMDFVQRHGGAVVGTASFLDRSSVVHLQETCGDVPIICLIHDPKTWCRQDDPKVRKHVKNNNIVWNPEAEWEKLIQQ